MEPLNLEALPEQALLLIDSAPIIYVLEGRAKLADRFRPLFAAHAEGRFRFAVTTITVAEVLTGPLQAGDEELVQRYRAVLESWQVVDLDMQIAETAARLRATLKLKLPDAVQAASAVAINADALVTHDRDLSRLGSLRVMS
jgi:predicted nucleic acid-binding protein